MKPADDDDESDEDDEEDDDDDDKSQATEDSGGKGRQMGSLAPPPRTQQMPSKSPGDDDFKMGCTSLSRQHVSFNNWQNQPDSEYLFTAWADAWLSSRPRHIRDQ